MRKELSMLEVIPRGYGLAYRIDYNMKYVIYPIPINIVVRLWHEFYWYVVCGYFKGKRDRWVSNIYKCGYADGATKNDESEIDRALREIIGKQLEEIKK